MSSIIRTVLAWDIIKEWENSQGTMRDYIEVEEDIFLWTASLVLLNHLANKESLQGKRVLELGSGLGHLAIGMAAFGAEVTATELDGPILHRLGESVQDQLEQKNGRMKGSIRCLPCSWGKQGLADSPEISSPNGQPYDLIIMAESIYKEELYPLLLETLTLLTQGGWRGSIWAVMVPRPFAYLFFAMLHDLDLFEVTEVNPVSLLGVEEVVMHQIRRKTN